jgi:hypothetical protein
MEKLIKNDWRRRPEEPFARARILSHEAHPEGLDVDRIRFLDVGSVKPDPQVGHIVSVLRGSGGLRVPSDRNGALRLESGVHCYLPPGFEASIDAEPGMELLRASGASGSQARGTELLLRNEVYLAASASGSHSLRWVLTPQYLSRRIFLHHDPVLLSKSGNPVSWFRTTMFDVSGLPKNDQGEPVFKMSYNSRTEFNVCYDVQGRARVRMALHPYREAQQAWGPWLPLDGNSTYHLNEAAGGPEEERRIAAEARAAQFFRNKHEVHIVDGHVTLFCLFDPAPTGIERHRPGAYSDYEPLSQVVGTKAYQIYQEEIARYDRMVLELSMARARDRLEEVQGTTAWELYLEGREAQAAIEDELVRTLAAEGDGRQRVVGRWMQSRVLTQAPARTAETASPRSLPHAAEG